jgi:hypothetical protein
MATGTEQLRTEIGESQKVRVDILKWKLILVAALGAASFGLAAKDSGREPLLLALVPFVCIYADIVCYHHDLRILAIARFLRRGDDEFWRAYEEHCSSLRDMFSLEAAALFWSTMFLSSLVAAVGVILSVVRRGPGPIPIFGLPLAPEALYLAGTMGATITIALQWRHDRKFLRLEGTKPASPLRAITPWLMLLLRTLVAALPAIAFFNPDRLALALGISECPDPLPLFVKVSCLVPVALSLGRFVAAFFGSRYDVIFDGTESSFKEWRQAAAGDAFEQRGEALVATTGSGSRLLYYGRRKFRTFELKLQILLPAPKTDDSGILFGVAEPAADGAIGKSCLEVQIDEIGRDPSGAKEFQKWRTAALLSDGAPLDTRWTRPKQIVGDTNIVGNKWMRCKISLLADGKTGSLVCVTEIGTLWRTKISSRTEVTKADPFGYLALQAYQGNVHFRRIAVREV